MLGFGARHSAPLFPTRRLFPHSHTNCPRVVPSPIVPRKCFSSQRKEQQPIACARVGTEDHGLRSSEIDYGNLEERFTAVTTSKFLLPRCNAWTSILASLALLAIVAFIANTIFKRHDILGARLLASSSNMMLWQLSSALERMYHWCGKHRDTLIATSLFVFVGVVFLGLILALLTKEGDIIARGYETFCLGRLRATSQVAAYNPELAILFDRIFRILDYFVYGGVLFLLEWMLFSFNCSVRLFTVFILGMAFYAYHLGVWVIEEFPEWWKTRAMPKKLPGHPTYKSVAQYFLAVCVWEGTNYILSRI